MPRRTMIIDPHLVKRLSPVAGCANSRRKRIEEYGYKWTRRINDVDLLNGPWDRASRDLKLTGAYRDFLIFKQGGKFTYPWNPLYEAIRKSYIQDPNKRHIEIGVCRNGEYVLVDGRHRLFIAQDLGIKIPVEVVYVHTKYSGIILW